MDDRVIFGVLTLLFNSLGVPCFMAGNTKAGVLRIVLNFVTCGIIGVINGIMGIIMGIKILTMSDEEFAAKKATLFMGVPAGMPAPAAPAETEEPSEPSDEN